jgi:hypothetical protein
MTNSSNSAINPMRDGDNVDLRRAPRFSVEMRVRVVPKAIANSSWFGQANDISEYGMALMVPTDIEIGARIDIEFTLPITRHKLILAAEIKNRNNFRYGVEFLFPTKHQREAIVKACRMLL